MTYTTDQNPNKLKGQYLDLKEYQSRFLLTPEIDSDADFTHFDKNLAITNLKHNPRLGIDEPEQARAVLKALHVLNNPKYFNKFTVKEFIGYKDVDNGDGTLTRTPVYQNNEYKISKFPKTYHSLKSKFLSLVNTAAARNGHRIDKAISNKIVQEQTLSDKTKVNKRFNFGRKNDD